MFKLKRLDQLKLMVSHEKDLSVIWSFYMDHFADYKEFTDLGKPTTNSLIEEVVEMISKQLFNESANQLRLIVLPKHNFIHGSFFVGPRIGGVLYFEKSRMGMIALSEGPLSNLIKYSRFKGQSMK